jgi:tetratricopeptide (TPR) repeat protein
MEIKYSKKKQEMRRDPFMDFLESTKKVFEDNSKSLLIVGIAIVLILSGYFGYKYVQKVSLGKAQESFGKAMVAYGSGDEAKAIDALKQVVEDHKSSSQAVYSAYLLGNMFLRATKYDEAITWFKLAESKKATTGFVGADALEGLADSYASKGDKDEAVKYLKEALADQRIRYRFPALAWKAALLSKELGKSDDAKHFCEQIIADTASQAAPLKQKAENFLTEIKVLEKS